jgi:hypothetical protein
MSVSVSDLEHLTLIKYPAFAKLLGVSRRSLGKTEIAQAANPNLKPRLPKIFIQNGRKFVRLVDAKAYLADVERHSEGVRLYYHGDKSRVRESAEDAKASTHDEAATAAAKETEQLHERRLLAAKREQEFNDYCAKRSAAE